MHLTRYIDTPLESDQEDLAPKQTATLRRWVKEEFK